MVQDYDQIQQRAAHHFLAHYENACAKQDSIPLSAIKMHLDKEMLDFNGDRVTSQDWPPLLSSICINKHLHHIAISSTYHPYLGSGDAGKVLIVEKTCLTSKNNSNHLSFLHLAVSLILNLNVHYLSSVIIIYPF